MMCSRRLGAHLGTVWCCDTPSCGVGGGLFFDMGCPAAAVIIMADMRQHEKVFSNLRHTGYESGPLFFEDP